jgi:predicted porin
VEFLAFGTWAEYEDFTANGNKEDMLVFGGGLDLTEAGDTDALLQTVDVQYENKRLGLYGAYLGRSVENLRVGTGAAATDVNTYDWGFIVQAAYMLNDHAEPFLRYDYMMLDSDGLAASVKENKVSEITAGMNYYYKSHNAKFTVDFTYLPNGTPVADSGADILVSDDEAEFLVRAQFQLLL